MKAIVPGDIVILSAFGHIDLRSSKKFKLIPDGTAIGSFTIHDLAIVISIDDDNNTLILVNNLIGYVPFKRREFENIVMKCC